MGGRADEGGAERGETAAKLTELLLKASAKLGDRRLVPDSLRKEMRDRQELVKISCKSDLVMSGRIK